jgi:hydroxylaminobenzene mutase
MNAGDWSLRYGHRLLQVGILLFLLALLVGLAVPRFAVPRLGVSAHLLGIMQGIFLMVIGLLWPRLALGRSASRLGCSLAIYGCVAAWTANLLAAVWGAGNTMLPMAAGQARGSAIQEGIITAGLRTAAISLIAVAILILWGLRAGASKQSKEYRS